METSAYLSKGLFSFGLASRICEYQPARLRLNSRSSNRCLKERLIFWEDDTSAASSMFAQCLSFDDNRLESRTALKVLCT